MEYANNQNDRHGISILHSDPALHHIMSRWGLPLAAEKINGVHNGKSCVVNLQQTSSADDSPRTRPPHLRFQSPIFCSHSGGLPVILSRTALSPFHNLKNAREIYHTARKTKNGVG